MRLTSDTATVIIDPDQGGRIASLEVFGHELLVTGSDDPVRWGSYPMVPFAGRVDSGHFTFLGTDHQLPLNDPPHALHGYGFISPWEQTCANELCLQFAHPWPFGGVAIQRFDLTNSTLTITMEVTATEAQPLILGWHPWFRREIDGHLAELEFRADWMFDLDDRQIPTGQLLPPPPGPWDNCFTGIRSAPVLRWGDLSLTLHSSTDYWVVYDKPEHALCVEPQTGVPNAFNRGGESVALTGQTMHVEFTMNWATR